MATSADRRFSRTGPGRCARVFARNLDNTYCEDVWKRDLLADAGQPAPFELSTLIRVTLAKNIAAEPGIDALERGLTLRSLVPAEPANQPAFTMNTTAVEDGSRFLLANYRVPQYLLDDTSGYPARSFLDTFGAGKSVMYDLPLATAAQLSATFPYVSSAARAPAAITASSDHFVDGGYYDNDGTVSAIEFLRYAITPPVDGTGPSIDQQAAKQLIAGISSKLNGSKLHILWIEIRNSGDCGDPPGDDPAWNLLDEVAAPPEALWRAGHDSVTGRNRVTLSMMQKALGANVEIVRIVMPDDHACSCSTQNSAAQRGSHERSAQLVADAKPAPRSAPICGGPRQLLRGGEELVRLRFGKMGLRPSGERGRLQGTGRGRSCQALMGQYSGSPVAVRGTSIARWLFLQEKAALHDT